MVVDAYALRIMAYFDYIFESYDEAAEWFSSLDYDEIYKILDSEKFDEIEILKLYHALILEFCKENFKGKILSQNFTLKLPCRVWSKQICTLKF